MQTETLQSTILHVTGMTCGGCTSAVTRALVAVDGVHNVNVTLASGEAKVPLRPAESGVLSPAPAARCGTARDGQSRRGRRHDLATSGGDGGITR